MTRRVDSKGLTLIELVVLIGIAGVLTAILIPSIYRVRRAADRVSCSSNLKQLGVGLHHYHSAYGAFPPNGGCRGSFYSNIQPFTAAKNSAADEHPGRAIKGWQCPTRGYRVAPVTNDKGEITRIRVPADYAAADHPGRLVNPDTRKLRYAGWHSVLGRYGKQRVKIPGKNDGDEERTIVFTYQPVNLQRINEKDGSAGTLLLAHKSSNDDAYETVSSWESDAFHVPDCRRFLEDKDKPGISAISAPHPAGMPVLFADGSVRTARYEKEGSDFVPRLWSYDDDLKIPTDFVD